MGSWIFSPAAQNGMEMINAGVVQHEDGCGNGEVAVGVGEGA